MSEAHPPKMCHHTQAAHPPLHRSLGPLPQLASDTSHPRTDVPGQYTYAQVHTHTCMHMYMHIHTLMHTYLATDTLHIHTCRPHIQAQMSAWHTHARTHTHQSLEPPGQPGSTLEETSPRLPSGGNSSRRRFAQVTPRSDSFKQPQIAFDTGNLGSLQGEEEPSL